MTRTGVPMGRPLSVLPGALHRIADGYVDEVIVTVRKMAAAGATDAEISEACGKKRGWATNYIRKNRLVWNRKSLDRHITLSVRTLENKLTKASTAWRTEALRMWADGATVRQIAAKADRADQTVLAFLRKQGVAA